MTHHQQSHHSQYTIWHPSNWIGHRRAISFFIRRYLLRFTSLILCGFSALFIIPTDTVQANDQERFNNIEIRVIRPKYFTKSGKFELGLQGSAIVNHSFIYIFHGNMNLTYHLSEGIAFEGSGNFGVSVPRQEKNILQTRPFSIRTIIHRTQHVALGSFLITPVYGKFQLGSRLTYFDFFLTFGGGISGIEYTSDDCKSAEGGSKASRKAATTRVANYPTMAVGGGQKIFINKHVAIRWDINYMGFWSNTKDSVCNDNKQVTGRNELESNVSIKLGISRFF
ncbi:MAG: outer membrane beta-barrel domain-containing protein [Proteobacteria bacterium]|nr:outer membrane beta-barrel domain-containing protein [Pseudomonadota bacterium]